MAQYISFQPSDFFTNFQYSGDSSSPRAFTGFGFQPDLIYEYKRNVNANKYFFDSVRGVGSGTAKQLEGNNTAVQSTQTNMIQSFDADGFTQGSDMNATSTNYGSFTWKAGTTSGISGGTITPTSYSINTTSGVGIYAFTGTGSAGTIAHGLGKAPSLVCIKCLDSDGAWVLWGNGLDGGTNYLLWNDTDTQNTNSAYYATAPTDTVISIGNGGAINGAPQLYIMYCFTNTPGFSKCGRYNGNGNVTGPYIYTGFRPAWFFMKNISTSSNWTAFNNISNPTNEVYTSIDMNVTNDEDSDLGYNDVDFLATGVKIREDNNDLNKSNDKFLYAAFAEFPTVSSNDVPGVAR